MINSEDLKKKYLNQNQHQTNFLPDMWDKENPCKNKPIFNNI